MARHVFFSFHYDRDSVRVAQVRNSNVVAGYDKNPFYDKAGWESIKRQGDQAVKNWIDNQIQGTSVTVVLIGAETASRKWVQYEIIKTCERKNGLIGIYIDGLKNFAGQTDYRGRNPFDSLGFDNYQGSGRRVNLSAIYSTYDYVADDGYNNMGKWIEAAASQVGK